MKMKSQKGYIFSDEEKKFIADNVMTMTYQDIADQLHVGKETLVYYLEKNKIRKSQRHPEVNAYVISILGQYKNNKDIVLKVGS